MAPVDDKLAERLSAYLDGELADDQAADVLALLAKDPELAAEMAALRRVDASVNGAFAASLDEPIPTSLLAAIDQSAARPVVANSPHAPRLGFGRIAAGLLLVMVGAAGGAVATRLAAPTSAVAATGWLDQVAAYHAVYAEQKNHLVEVAASDPALVSWLAKSTGVTFEIPDLTSKGLIFKGGRLLVANGKPVAQLMYVDAEGQVVALCFQAGGDAQLANERSPYGEKTFDSYRMLSWKSVDAAYVVIGDQGRSDLRAIADQAALSL